jgi:hypothetical protein
MLKELARNKRLEARVAEAMAEARRLSEAASGKPARVFRDFLWSTKDSWSRRRRVIGKAEWTGGEANPRFLVTSLKPDVWTAKPLYEDLYCKRGEMENRIKEAQGDLFADHTSAATIRANQLRLWFASMAYVLLCALRRIGLAHTQFAAATCGTIRLKLLKIGALVKISARRVKIAFASACPSALEWRLAAARLGACTRLAIMTRDAARFSRGTSQGPPETLRSICQSPAPIVRFAPPPSASSAITHRCPTAEPSPREKCGLGPLSLRSHKFVRI